MTPRALVALALGAALAHALSCAPATAPAAAAPAAAAPAPSTMWVDLPPSCRAAVLVDTAAARPVRDPVTGQPVVRVTCTLPPRAT